MKNYKVKVGDLIPFEQIRTLCEKGHMGQEITFVPRGQFMAMGQVGVMQIWSTEYGAENLAKFSFQGKDGDAPVWKLEEYFHPVVLRLLTDQQERVTRELITRADSFLSLLYSRGEHVIPWSSIGGEDFRQSVNDLINQLRSHSKEYAKHS